MDNNDAPEGPARVMHFVPRRLLSGWTLQAGPEPQGPPLPLDRAVWCAQDNLLLVRQVTDVEQMRKVGLIVKCVFCDDREDYLQVVKWKSAVFFCKSLKLGRSQDMIGISFDTKCRKFYIAEPALVRPVF